MSSDEESYAYSEEDYDMPSDASDVAMDNPNAAPAAPRKSLFCQASALRPQMDALTADVADVLGIPSTAAIVLLHAFDWQKAALLEAYMEQSSALLNKHGVKHRCNTTLTTSSLSASTTNTGDCPICYEDDLPTLNMPCGHAFCVDCWRQFANNSLSEGPSCIFATCPEATCNEAVTLEEYQPILIKSQLEQVQNYHLKQYVASNRQLRWCPGADCTMVVQVGDSHVACTSCRTEFCSHCGDTPHAPATCAHLEQWHEKCRNESETANWILANTKSCPKCSSRIEKNQGCNHMKCQKCRFEFCWICLGEWSLHGTNTGGYYKCNKFEEPAKDATQAKRDLDRYLHFYKRYHAHHQAQEFAARQLRETEARMIALQESQALNWSDVEFLKHANEQLVECRRVLQFTYVFCYYHFADNTRELERTRFEHHQEMLERFTESLSEVSERPIDQMERADVVNQTRVVDKFVQNMLEYVANGMEDEY